MRIGHARPSSALLGAAESVATRAIFVSVEGSLRGTSCRRENRAIPSQAGLFSGQDEVHPPWDASLLVAVTLKPGVHLAAARERTLTTPGVATLVPMASLAEAVLRRPRRDGAARRGMCRS